MALILSAGSVWHKAAGALNTPAASSQALSAWLRAFANANIDAFSLERKLME